MKIEENTFVLAKALLSREGSLLAAEYHPTDAVYVNVDIANADCTKSGVQIVVEKLGNLKGVVHCAGIAVQRPWSNDVADLISDFIKMMNVNSISTFIVNAQVADAINKPVNHPERPVASGSNSKTGDHYFSSAAAHGLYARTLCYGPSKIAVVRVVWRTFSAHQASISLSIVQSNMTAGFSGYLTATSLLMRRSLENPLRTGYVIGEDIRVDSAWGLVRARTPGTPDPKELAPGLEQLIT
ncbi:3-oxoacyl-reductase [Lipomyces starkeyi]